MTAAPVAPELALRAAAAWEMLSRAENPMPVPVALDWLQDEHDDRQECKRALYAEAAERAGAGHIALGYRFWNGHDSCTGRSCVYLARGEFAAAERQTRWLDDPGHAPPYSNWRVNFLRGLALCRAIEAA